MTMATMAEHSMQQMKKKMKYGNLTAKKNEMNLLIDRGGTIRPGRRE